MGELYNINELPLSNDPNVRNAQVKVICGEELSVRENMLIGRDAVLRQLGDYELKPDHAYRAISKELLEIYHANGMIIGIGIDDEYEEHYSNGMLVNNNKGVDWYLGGVALKYGDIVIECPADKLYFELTSDNGSGMSRDPLVRFIKSSGYKNPVPMGMITNIIDAKEIKNGIGRGR